MANVEIGTFRLHSVDPDYTFVADFGDSAPLPTDDSYGGWSVVEIPKRMGLTEWGGRPPMGLAIDFMIDRINTARSRDPGPYVRRMRDILEKMAATHSRDEEPPLCIFNSGGLCPHDSTAAPNVRWVIESLSWDRDLTVNNNVGNPIRIAGSLVLRQYNHDDALDAYRGPAAKKRRKKKNKRKRRGGNTYIVVRGDTLSSIAASQLGSGAKWKEIADLNNIRNPRTGLKVGMELKLPR